MARFVAAWELGGGMGHVTTLRPFVQHLVDRGHEVTAILKDLSRAASTFQRPGVKFFQAPLGQSRPVKKFEKTLSFAQLLHNTGFESIEDLSTRVRAWRTLYEIIKPDMILFDHCPTGLLAARGLPLKRVLVGTGFFSPPDLTPWPCLQPGTDYSQPSRLADEARVLHVANSALSGIDVPLLGSLAELYSGVDENILMTFPELDPYPQRGPAVYFGTWSSAVGEKPVWPTGPGPRIFAYLKPFASLEKLLRRLRELNHPTLVVVDGVEETVRKECSSDRMRIWRDPLELGEIGRTCDLAILNGTHGTTTSLLLSGRPILEIPLFKEQVINSRAVMRMGAGLMASPNAPEDIIAKLDQLLARPAFARQAKRFAAHHSRFDSVRQEHFVTRHIEQLALGKSTAINSHRSAPDSVAAESLLSSSRIDVLAKLIQLRQLRLNVENEWCTRLYLDHLRVINEYWNSIPLKTQPAHFDLACRDLLKSARQHGLNGDRGVVSITNKGELINGAHRVALGLTLQIPVPCRKLALSAPDYSFQRFQEPQASPPLSMEQLDALAVEFVRFCPSVRVGLSLIPAKPVTTATPGPETGSAETSIPNLVYSQINSVSLATLTHGCGIAFDRLAGLSSQRKPNDSDTSPISVQLCITAQQPDQQRQSPGTDSVLFADNEAEANRWVTTLLSAPTRRWWIAAGANGSDVVNCLARVADWSRQQGLTVDDFGVLIHSCETFPTRNASIEVVYTAPRITPETPEEFTVRQRLPEDQANMQALFDPAQCLRLHGHRVINIKSHPS
ncbi:MAG: hypothetical protein H7Z17_08320 [Fuerstia sp.]|nr:hypothetical protein [Fuerstiella sp.]